MVFCCTEVLLILIISISEFSTVVLEQKSRFPSAKDPARLTSHLKRKPYTLPRLRNLHSNPSPGQVFRGIENYTHTPQVRRLHAVPAFDLADAEDIAGLMVVHFRDHYWSVLSVN